MTTKILQNLICAASLLLLQGCFVWHSTTEHDVPAAQTTTVYHDQPAGDSVVTTTC